jgi:predicted Holliday junction resolvase-like endonuclease
MVELVGVLIGIIVGLVILLFLIYQLGLLRGRYEREVHWQENLGRIRREIADKQRVGIKGSVSEKFAPFLSGFPYKASECTFVGNPIDYIVFEGLDNRDVKKIHFVEVKSGTSKMNDVQKQIKDVVERKAVSFKEFRFEE